MKLFFRKYGEGPPLIILHGLYGSSDNWIHIARNIQHCYTVYLPDMRNHGHSPWSENHSYQDMSNDIVEFFGDQNLQQAFIAGHSMGGKTAIRFAVDNPGKVSGLFVGDISPFTYLSGSPADDQHKDILRIMTTVDPGNFNTREDVEAYLTTIAGEKTTRLVFSKNIVADDGKLRWRINAKSIANNIDKLIEGIPRPSEENVFSGLFPVIFLKGDRSLYIPESDLEDIKRVFPQAQIRVVANSGHWIHTDRPDAVIEALKDLYTLSTGESCN